MDSSELIIKNSINDQPIGETYNVVWFICDIGIFAMFKRDINISENKILSEALSIGLDLSREEKKFYLIEGKK